MNVGMIGLGKLGLPVAVALGQSHTVYGYDKNPTLMRKRLYEHREQGLGPKSFQEMFDRSDLKFADLPELSRKCPVIFVAVQTPHQPEYEGITRIPTVRADFDYSHLIAAVRSLSEHVTPEQIVIVISTCLPGTIRKHIAPLLAGKCRLVYNPFFIAMGTVIHDFFNPEFVLLGSDDKEAMEIVKTFYQDVHGKERAVCGWDCPSWEFRQMSIESAELTKVAYNAFVGMKIVYANTMMEIAHKLPGCNVDDVMRAIMSATDRLISTKYLIPGQGDGGGCHPRDGIAMSWLARKLELSHDLFQDIMKAREDQASWLVDLMLATKLPCVILGKAFKPETNIVTGSPSILCGNLLKERGVEVRMWDPYVDSGHAAFERSVFLIGTRHHVFAELTYPDGSVVIDPHRYIPKRDGVRVIHVGAVTEEPAGL
jgi:UDPglucose 6-dehydrogenase